MAENFTHLHVHTTYSLLDGYNKPENAAKRAAELGMTAMAITDHNHLAGVLDFQDACKKNGIKPILGMEGYWTWDTNILSLPKEERDEIALAAAAKDGIVFNPKAKKSDIKEQLAPYEYDTKQYHIILLAMNQAGWTNLVHLQSESAAKCTYNGRFLCDDELLEKYNEGIIFMTACIGNTIPQLINHGKIEEAEAQIDKWHNIFGDRFYIEIQPLNVREQRVANYQLLEFAHHKKIKVVVTNDAHYTNFSDYDDHDTLLCIGTGAKKNEENRMHYSNDFWIKSYDEMIETFTNQAHDMTEEFGDIGFN